MFSLILILFVFFHSRNKQKYYNVRRSIHSNEHANCYKINPPKPPWVKQEVIRLKSFMTYQGCRKVAETFNRLHEQNGKMTVSKSYVAYIIKQHKYAIYLLRQQNKHKRPKPVPKNLIWATDLTTVTDATGKQNRLIGIVDHGTRACLTLEAIKTKHSIVLLKLLLNAIEKYGKPKHLRTDNEIVFTSKTFRCGLWVLGIKHQTTEMHCPWQNGRIERFFGTFKNVTNKLIFETQQSIETALPEYRFWYNHVRTHDYLDGLTPAEKWDGKDRKTNKPMLFEGWGGLLAGYYFRR